MTILGAVASHGGSIRRIVSPTAVDYLVVAGGGSGGAGGGGGTNIGNNATDNSGGGGCGVPSGRTDGTGGSGIVIIAYPNTFANFSSIGGGLSYTLDTSSRSGYKVYTFTGGTGTVTI